MTSSGYLLLSLTILFFSINLAERPKIIDLNYTVVQSSILGNDLTIGVFEVDFDQDIYLTELDYCFPACPEYPNPECMPCNYVSHGEQCGKPQRNESHSNSSAECQCPDIGYCDETVYTWMELEEGVKYTGHIVEEDATFYRFYFNKPCHGIRISVKDEIGRSQFALDYDQGPITRDKVTQAALFTPTHDGLMCPKSPFYTYGTAYLSIWSLSGRANVSIIWTTFDTSSFEEIPYEPIANYTCPDQPNAYCPQPKIPVEFTSPWRLPTYFRITVTECTLYLLHRELIWTNGPTTGGNGILFGIEKTYTTPNYYYGSSIRPHVVKFCPERGAKKTNYYFTLINLDAPLFTMIMFITPYYDVIPKPRMIPLEDISGPAAYRNLQGFLELTCVDRSFFCAPGCSGWPLCCLDLWPVVPDETIMPLYPVPIVFQTGDKESFGSILDYNEQKAQKRKGAIVVALEYTLGGASVVNLPDWRNNLDSQCNLTTLPFSEFMTADYEILFESFPVQGRRRDYQCDSYDISSVSDRISFLTQNFSSLSGPDLYSRRYQIDEQTFGEAWQGCDAFAQSFLVETKEEKVIQHTTGCPTNLLPLDSEVLNDPCCSEKTSWTQCCTPRDLTVNDTIKAVPEQYDKEICDSICLDSLLEDYIFYTSLIDSVEGCNTALGQDPQVTRRNGLQFYVNCKEKWFGSDGKGKHCLHDTECTTGYCDILKQTCVYHSQSSYQTDVNKFFECIVEETPASIREYILSSNGQSTRSDADQAYLEILLSNFQIKDCLSDYGRSEEGSHVLWIPRATSGCPACDFICFDEWCPLPIDCEYSRQYGRPNSICAATSGDFVNDELGCTSTQICSVDSLIDSCENHTEPYYCVICESPTSCVIVPDVKTESECSGVNFCLSPNGEAVSGLTNQQCELFGICSINCPNCTKEQCLSIGRCSDRDIEDYIWKNLQLKHENQEEDLYIPPEDGFCYTNMFEWNSPECSSGSLTTSTYLPFSSHCLYTENLCTGDFHYYATTKEECEFETTCHQPDKVFTSLRTPKNKEECDLCGGDSIPTFEWTQGSWISGQIRKGTWRKTETISKNRWDSTIDFKKMAQLFVQAIDAPYTLLLETELYCRLNPKRVLIDGIACTCDKTRSDSDCFSSESIQIGVGKACPNIATDLIAPPSVLSFHKDSVNENCVNIAVKTLLEAELKTPQTVVISTSFRKIISGDSPVKNSKGSFVGQTLGNGILLELSSKDIQNFKICIVLDATTFDVDEKYTVFDFGYKVTDEDVRPYGIVANLERSSFCGYINMSYDHSLSFYPIIREESWEGDNDGELTSGAIASYVIMLILYTIVIIFGISVESQMGFDDIKPIRLVGWYLLIACAIRGLYFLLLAADVAGTGDTNLLDFILIEAPTFLYFAALFTAVSLWIGITRQSAQQHNKQVRISSFLFLLLSLATLVSVIAAWRALEEDGKYYCNGRIYEEPDDSDQKNVQTFYRVIVIIITIIIIAFIIISSFSVFRTVSKTSMKKGVFIKKVLAISVISSTSLIAQCIFFGIYSEQGDFNYGWSFILIPIEIIPILMVIMLIAQSKAVTAITQRFTGTVSSSNSGNQMNSVPSGTATTQEKDEV